MKEIMVVSVEIQEFHRLGANVICLICRLSKMGVKNYRGQSPQLVTWITSV